MDPHGILTLVLIAAGIAILIGLADIALALVRRHSGKLKNVWIGAAFVLLGLFIIWLGLQGPITLHIYLGPQGNKIGTILLVLLVFGMFIVKSVMNIR